MTAMRAAGILWVLGAAVLSAAGVAVAKDEKLPEVGDPAKVKPGQTALLKAPKGLRYFLRVPKGYDPKAGARLVVFLHGSNMNGLSYVRSFEAKRWAEDAVLCCPNGEEGNDPYGANNFTFESAPLVADVTEQVKGAFKVKVAYCGGHSQGGFLTYSVILNFPDLFQGAMPMAGDCWMQNEPNLWDGQAEIAEKQRRIAIAVVHGKNDPVVKFEQGEHAYDVFRAAGWTRLRLFDPPSAGHMFMVYPVDDVLDWLDAMNGIDPKSAAKLAKKWAKDGEWGWAREAVANDPTAKGGDSELRKAAEAAAAKEVPGMEEAMKGKPAEWIPKWLEFWRIHGGTAAAKPLVDGYLAKRAEQASEGKRLFDEATGLGRKGDRNGEKKILEQILAEAPCTYEAYYAWKWLASWK